MQKAFCCIHSNQGHLVIEKVVKRETERERIEKRMKEHHSLATGLAGKWELQKART